MRWAPGLILAIAATSGAASARAPQPAWSVYADCAAAYLANARIADPGRPASMTAQVSDVADDYAKAARDRYRREAKAAAATAARTVKARIDKRAAEFARQPREAVERVIDACPQTGG